MQNKFKWCGIDGAGFYYGFYRNGGQQYHLDIAVPGKGMVSPHPGPDFKINVNMNEVGKASSLEEAKNFLTQFFAQGLHKNLGREQAAGQDHQAGAGKKRGGR